VRTRAHGLRGADLTRGGLDKARLLASLPGGSRRRLADCIPAASSRRCATRLLDQLQRREDRAREVQGDLDDCPWHARLPGVDPPPWWGAWAPRKFAIVVVGGVATGACVSFPPRADSAIFEPNL
jgi:hypothetical protein